MGNSELATPVPAFAVSHAAPAVAPAADLDIRWAAWMRRGRAQEQRVRRRFTVWAGVLTLAAAIVYAFLRS